jgi:hypothetical protein
MSFRGHYNPNMIDDMSEYYWTSSSARIYGYSYRHSIFSGEDGKIIGFLSDNTKCTIRLVRPIGQDVIPGPLEQVELVLVADQIRAFMHLGPQYRVGNLIWSSAVHNQTYNEAKKLANSLGGNKVRLPSINDYEDLYRAMSPGWRYNSNMIADMHEHLFWMISVYPDVGPDYYRVFNGFNGSTRIELKHANTKLAVRFICSVNYDYNFFTHFSIYTFSYLKWQNI